MGYLQDLNILLPRAGKRLRAYEPMAARTTFRTGGPADVFFEPSSVGELAKAAGFCHDEGIPLLIIGNGSNILVSDAGIRGVVISIGEHFSGMSWQNGLMAVKAGTKLSAASAFSARQGFSGLEFASGIPGTLGGAVFMNAGAYDHCMGEVVAETDYLDDHLALCTLPGEAHQFGYRSSFFSKTDGIILESRLRLERDDPEKILSRIAELAVRRKASQPLEMPSAGSVFKRPSGLFAGKLISGCGLKGCRAGDAQVSEKHANFIVNAGRAKADDIRRLIEHVQKTVEQETGILLEKEIRYVGDWRHWTGQEAGAANDG